MASSSDLLRFRARKLRHFFGSWPKAVVASVASGFPARRLKVYGITGTDGKTTSSTLLYHVLKTAGYKVALISTVAAYIGDEEIDTGFHVTSPEHWQVQRLLKRCADEGVEHVVLEVTSHGIFQYRTWGISFKMVGITNIDEEHLDYFVNFELYASTKAELLLKAEKRFIPAEDRSTSFLRRFLTERGKKWAEYSPTPAKDAVGRAVYERFPEEYNRKNAQLVQSMAAELGVQEEALVRAFQTFPGVKGRMQEISNRRKLLLIVDFAHTPQALEAALIALRARTKGRLFAVFGCAGLRDHTKRPKMGEIGSHLADVAIFTAEDPRTEKLQVILRQMKEGVQVPNHRKVVTVPDRRQAIAFALSQAKPGDTIGVFGKGHELSMNFGAGETPWSDQKALQELLGEKS